MKDAPAVGAVEGFVCRHIAEGATRIEHIDRKIYRQLLGPVDVIGLSAIWPSTGSVGMLREGHDG
jgi:hypothetical protein